MTNQDTGAKWAYHGHRVWFEWQSLQAWVSICSTSGGTATAASSVLASMTGGFVRAGLMNCIDTMRAANPNIAPRVNARITFSLGLMVAFGCAFRHGSTQTRNSHGECTQIQGRSQFKIAHRGLAQRPSLCGLPVLQKDLTDKKSEELGFQLRTATCRTTMCGQGNPRRKML